jgi:prepilin-type N-terminal cleavage/methylation domain-containing protein
MIQEALENMDPLRRGFTLVELSVVIVVIGVLAAFAVPKFAQSVERSKASEAFSYLNAIRSSQENYHNRQGAYATCFTDLDVSMTAPKYFNVPTSIGADENNWNLRLSRLSGSSGYGQYTVEYNQDGYDNNPADSNINNAVNPMTTN